MSRNPDDTSKGWKLDPEDPTRLRFWDGEAWTGIYHEIPEAPPEGPESLSKASQDQIKPEKTPTKTPSPSQTGPTEGDFDRPTTEIRDQGKMIWDPWAGFYHGPPATFPEGGPMNEVEFLPGRSSRKTKSAIGLGALGVCVVILLVAILPSITMSEAEKICNEDAEQSKAYIDQAYLGDRDQYLRECIAYEEEIERAESLLPD